ncbi:MAG: zinc ribbon domain-containing protein [Capsulimonadales bacterium]|nr:zinc ribbon domain-containing protein [Capsulimonadales bacterium]
MSAERITPRVRSHRRAGSVVFRTGIALTIFGAGAVLWGSLLPWQTLTVFDMPIAPPGLVGWGAATAACGLLALTRPRSAPLLALFLGLLCLGIATDARRTIGRATARRVLEVKQRLAPINARLEAIRLPPIEPFPSSVLARNFVGPGPEWTLWGGVLLVLGGTFRFAGNRLERTCAACGRFRGADRRVLFCDRCGTPADAFVRCSRCFTAAGRDDRFCVQCGFSLQSSSAEPGPAAGT